jgi:hypothetical protein
VETTGIEPATSWLQTRERPVLTDAAKEVTSRDSARCTPGCTREETEPSADPLAAFVASLSVEQRRRLAGLLASQGRESSDEAKSGGLCPAPQTADTQPER